MIDESHCDVSEGKKQSIIIDKTAADSFDKFEDGFLDNSQTDTSQQIDCVQSSNV
jgi:hypothetical protein